MHVGNRFNLGGRSSSELAHGVRSTGENGVRRLAFLSEREPVRECDALVQGIVGGRPIRYTSVDHDLGLFWNRFYPVGLLDSR